MRSIRVHVGAVAADFELLDEMAPNSAQMLWETLPIDGQITHGRWAGSAVWTKTPRTPLANLEGNECPVTSLYPGMLFVRQGPRNLGEVLISYGQAEARSFTGPGYATPVALIIGPTAEFFDELKKTWSAGSTGIVIEQIAEQPA